MGPSVFKLDMYIRQYLQLKAGYDAQGEHVRNFVHPFTNEPGQIIVTPESLRTWRDDVLRHLGLFEKIMAELGPGVKDEGYIIDEKLPSSEAVKKKIIAVIDEGKIINTEQGKPTSIISSLLMEFGKAIINDYLRAQKTPVAPSILNLLEIITNKGKVSIPPLQP